MEKITNSTVADAQIELKIFGWLDLRSVASVGRVCSNWRSICMLFSISMTSLEYRIKESVVVAKRLETLAKALSTCVYLPLSLLSHLSL